MYKNIVYKTIGFYLFFILPLEFNDKIGTYFVPFKSWIGYVIVATIVKVENAAVVKKTLHAFHA